MAKAKQEIRTESYIHVGDKLVNTKDLNKAQRNVVGARLKTDYLNALFAGRAVFCCPDLPKEDVFANLR